MPRRHLAQIRRANLARILNAISATPAISQTTLVAQTGLASGAVSSLVNELLDAGMVVATDSVAPGRGRPRRELRLRNEHAELIGISVTRTQIRARATTLAGQTLGEATRTLDEPPGVAETSELITELVRTSLGSTLELGSDPQLAVSLPGARSESRGLLASTELRWLVSSPDALVDAMHHQGWQRVEVGNDGAYATLAEVDRGAARGLSNAVVVYLGRGLGGSAVVGGRLLHGATGAAGFGHTPVDPHGARCNCGMRGCAEMTLSLHRFALELGIEDDHATPGDLADELARRAIACDPDTLSLLAEARVRLEQLGSVLASVLNAERIVVTGAGARLAPWLLPATVGFALVPVTAGELAEDAPLVGALVAAREAAFATPPAPRRD